MRLDTQALRMCCGPDLFCIGRRLACSVKFVVPLVQGAPGAGKEGESVTSRRCVAVLRLVLFLRQVKCCEQLLTAARSATMVTRTLTFV